MVILHVLLALAGLGLAIFNYFKPSELKLRSSYGLAAGTLASGVMLIVIGGASIVRTCLTGIAFFAVVSVLNELARKKLATDAVDI